MEGVVITLCDPGDCSLPGSSIRGIPQARILEWVSISFSKKKTRVVHKLIVCKQNQRTAKGGAKGLWWRLCHPRSFLASDTSSDNNQPHFLVKSLYPPVFSFLVYTVKGVDWLAFESPFWCLYLGFLQLVDVQIVKVLVAQSLLTLCDLMDCNPPASSVYGILQARVVIPFSRGSSRLRDRTWVSHIEDRFFTIWATREALVDVKPEPKPRFPASLWSFLCISLFSYEKWVFSLNQYSKARVPNLQDLMPDDLRWSWHNNNRNEVHSKYNVLESSWNHPCLQSVEELSSMKLVPGAKKLGTVALKCLEELLFMLVSPNFRRKFHIMHSSNQVIRALKFHFLPQGKHKMMR